MSTLDVEFLLGDAAVSLDVLERTVHTTSGRALAADDVVIATGLWPRTLPGQDGLGGVLGTETAASAAGMGVPVTLAGPQPGPLASQFGPLVSDLLAELHASRGVGLRLGAAVTRLDSRDGRVPGVRLETGEVLPVDVVVVAFGAAPATEWLEGSGLVLANGVVCDSRCRAAQGVHAVGDVARWQHETLDVALRLENRTNATEQAGHVAAVILGDDRP